MHRYLSLLLFIGLAWGKTAIKISGYDNLNNSFFCEDTSQNNISAFSFINSLKKVSDSNQIKNRKLRKCIAKYSKASKKFNEMVILYQKGKTHEDGIIIVEDFILSIMLNIFHNYNLNIFYLLDMI